LLNVTGCFHADVFLPGDDPCSEILKEDWMQPSQCSLWDHVSYASKPQPAWVFQSPNSKFSPHCQHFPLLNFQTLNIPATQKGKIQNCYLQCIVFVSE
jgi:hypothetical protein